MQQQRELVPNLAKAHNGHLKRYHRSRGLTQQRENQRHCTSTGLHGKYFPSKQSFLENNELDLYSPRSTPRHSERRLHVWIRLIIRPINITRGWMSPIQTGLLYRESDLTLYRERDLKQHMGRELSRARCLEDMSGDDQQVPQ